MKKLLLILLLLYLPMIGYGQKEPRKAWSTYEINDCNEGKYMTILKEFAEQISVPIEQFIKCYCEQLEKKYSSYYEVSKIEFNEKLMMELTKPCIPADFPDFPDFECIEGDCVDGYGKIFLDSEKIYKGKFKDGLPHGKGLLIIGDVQGSGRWKNGKMDGKFILKDIKSGEKIKLYFMNGVLKQ